MTPPGAALAQLLASELAVPHYERIHDGMAVPCVVQYPDNPWVQPGGWCDHEWRYRVTALAARADVSGALALTEQLLLDVIACPLETIGAQWTEAGGWRIETIAGIDYVAADVSITVFNDQP